MKYVNISKNAALKEQIEKQKEEKNKSKDKGLMKIFVFFLSLILLISLSFLMFGNNVKAIFNPVSIVGNVSSAELEESDGRTNILVLGSDERESDTRANLLTDTILVASIGKVENDVVMISLPRDLWVKAKADETNTYYEKVNAVYAISGSEELKDVIENVLGIPIHYYVVVDFNLFKDVVDTLGGVDVNVERAFTDYYYPVEGKEAAPFNERYQTVAFEAGIQNMDGEEALKYVRSRKGDNDEGTDFARAARQQQMILAIKDKALTFDTLVNPVKIKELYDIYNETVDTDIELTDMQNFYLLSEQVDFTNFKTVVLDDRSAAEEGGLLYAPEDRSLYRNAYVLIPRSGDFSQVHAYVQRYVFGN